MVAARAGGALLLDLEPGRPLGVGGGTYVDQRFDLSRGAVLMLYTDGLVEERDASLDDGLDRLVGALAAPVRSADEACTRVLRAHSGATPAPTTTPRCWRVHLLRGADAGGAPAARPRRRPGRPDRVCASVARAHGLDSDLPSCSSPSWSATRCGTARAGGAGDAVVLRVTAQGPVVRVEVDDCSEHLPEVGPDGGSGAESGRGLLLVAELAQRWGAHPFPGGKRVWFEVAGELLGQPTRAAPARRPGSKPSTWP